MNPSDARDTNDGMGPVEAIPEDASHWRREHFIPIRPSDLTRILGDELPKDQQKTFRELCRLVHIVISLDFHGHLARLKSAYAAVNPDADKTRLNRLTRQQREQQIANLFRECEQLLVRANFQRLTQGDLREVVGAASDWGVRLNVDFDIFQRLDVYARGDIVGKRIRRRLRNLYRPEQVEVPIYQRLAAIFHLRDFDASDDQIDDNRVYLKLLKNVPKTDVDMMLPGGRVRMSLWDGGRILLPVVSGITIAVIKLLKIVVFASLYGMLAVAGLVVGTIGYAAKTFFGYRRFRDKYELNWTRRLYYQNLDNNAGVFFRLIDDAQEQEFCEIVLGYQLLCRRAGPTGWSEKELDLRAEERLKEICDVDVDFEVDDALAKLRRLNLAQQDESLCWFATPIDEALKQLQDRARKSVLTEVT